MRGYTGNGISNIAKTGTSGLIDTYTITYTDGNTTTFTVTNGKGISSIVKTSSAGLVDNYRITYNDGTYFDYTVTNGKDGEVTEEELQDVYEQMSSELEDGTGTGTSIDTTDSAYWKADIELAGNTTQEVISAVAGTEVTGTDLTITDYDSTKENKFIKLSGNTSQSTNIITYSCTGNESGDYYFVYNNVNYQFTMPTIQTGDVIYFNTDTLKLYLSTTEIATTTASTGTLITMKNTPNPDYPQDIQVVKGSNNVKVQNKNYLDISKCVMGANNTTVNTTITYSTKTNRACTKFDVNPIYVKANTTYTIKRYSNYNFSVAQLTSSNKVLSDSSWKSANYSFTTSANCQKITLNFKKNNDANFTIEEFKTAEFQVEEGSTSTSYIPHQEQNFPITLPTGMKLCKIGDYQDYIYKNGDNWYKKEYVRHIQLPFSSLSDSFNPGWANVPYIKNDYPNQNGILKDITSFKCNIFLDTFSTIRINTTGNVSAIFLYSANLGGLTGAQLKEKYPDLILDLYYVLETSTDTQITDTTLIGQLEAIEEVTGYEDIMYITSTNTTNNENNLAIVPRYKYNFVTPAPSPERESEIQVVKGSNNIEITNSDNTQSQNYPITLPTGMELCKIGNNQDYIYKNLVNGNWYKHSEIGKFGMNTLANLFDNITYFQSNFNSNNGIISLRLYKDLFSNLNIKNVSFNNYYNEKLKSQNGGWNDVNSKNHFANIDGLTIWLYYTDLGLNEWTVGEIPDLSTKLTTYFGDTNFYLPLRTPTDTQITDTTLINQLNDIEKKLKTYQGITHITQTNEDMPFILTLDYKKSNLLRIQALEEANS